MRSTYWNVLTVLLSKWLRAPVSEGRFGSGSEGKGKEGGVNERDNR